jgi:hypothetical protein
MSTVSLLSRLKVLFRRGRMEEDLSEEVQFHLENPFQLALRDRCERPVHFYSRFTAACVRRCVGLLCPGTSGFPG